MTSKLLLSLIWGLLLVILIGAAPGCQSAETPWLPSLEVTDQLGRVVKLEKVPQRIISLAPSNTEILFALGLGDQIVGVTSYCDYPPQAKEKEKVGGFSTPDLEKVVALSPDLIVAASIHAPKVIPELERRGLPVLALAPETIDDVLEAIDLTGQLTGREVQAEALLKDMKRRLEPITKLTARLSHQERPKVFSLLWHDPLRTVGSDTLQSQLVQRAGGENIFGALTGYPRVDLEVLLQRDPQLILAQVGHGSAGQAPFDWAKGEPRLKETEALKTGRVYPIDSDLVARAGPRLVDGLEEMFRLLHPELAGKK